jgi:hypothetical protein
MRANAVVHAIVPPEREGSVRKFGAPDVTEFDGVRARPVPRLESRDSWRTLPLRPNCSCRSDRDGREVDDRRRGLIIREDGIEDASRGDVARKDPAGALAFARKVHMREDGFVL